MKIFIVVIIILIYMVYFSSVTIAVADYYGKDSLMAIFILIINGPVLPLLLGTHDKIEQWLKKL